MKLVIERDLLYKSIQQILPIIEKKVPRPVLSNLLLEASEEHLTIQASDLEIFLKFKCSAKILESGKLCVDAKNFASIVRELPSGKPVELISSNEKNSLGINLENIHFEVNILSAQDFPNFTYDRFEKGFDLKVQGKEFTKFINPILHAISFDETRIFFNGIFLKAQAPGTLRAVALDGYRLAYNEWVGPFEETPIIKKGIIIPRKAIFEIKKLSDSNPEANIKFAFDEHQIHFEVENEAYLMSRLIQKEFPNYNAYIPNETVHSFNVNRTEALNAVKRTKILANETTNGVKLQLEEDRLTISAESVEQGQARQIIPVVYGKDVKLLGFNAKYLVDLLSNLECSEVEAGFNNELSPFIVTCSDRPGFLGLIMPLKLHS